MCESVNEESFCFRLWAIRLDMLLKNRMIVEQRHYLTLVLWIFIS